MLTFQFTPFPELRTARLHLRALRETDAPALLPLRSEPEVMRYLDREPDASEEDSLTVIRSVAADAAAGTGITWAIVHPETDQLLGTIGFWRTVPAHHRAEVGYVLHPGQWR